MATIKWDEPGQVYVGDTGPTITLVITEEDGETLRNLTGYAAGVSFWYPGSTPHAARQAWVIAASGEVYYRLLGDEFPTPGKVLLQATVMSTETYAGTGRGFAKISGPVVTRTVLARPI